MKTPTVVLTNINGSTSSLELFSLGNVINNTDDLKSTSNDGVYEGYKLDPSLMNFNIAVDNSFNYV